MKALSIKQPWASLIAHGIKDIENRTWKTKFRGRIFIHVSAKSAINTHILSEAQRKVLRDRTTPVDITHLSAIIGEVDIIDCVINHPSIWAEPTTIRHMGDNVSFIDGDPIYNWVLANPVLYDKPILNVKGKLSFWDFEKPTLIK